MKFWEANIDQADPAWRLLVEGNPVCSSYMWKTVLFTLLAFLGMAKVGSKIYGKRFAILQWAPILIAALALMVIYGASALRALRRARSEVAANRMIKGTDENLTFQKFRAYYQCAAYSGILLMLLGACL